jgi:Type II intron maturase
VCIAQTGRSRNRPPVCHRGSAATICGSAPGPARCQHHLAVRVPRLSAARQQHPRRRGESNHPAEYRGIVQYYLLAGDVYRLGRLRWVMLTSLLKTLASKHRWTVTKIAAKHQATITTPYGPRTCFEAITQRAGRKPLVVRRNPLETAEDRGHRRPRPGPDHSPPQGTDHPAPNGTVRALPLPAW